MENVVALLIVVFLPWLVSRDSGRAWLLSGPRGVFVWVMLTVAAIVGSLAGTHLLGSNIQIGAAVLVATPFLQALIFVVADRLFILMVRRIPVSMGQARNGRRPDGRRWWPDVAFWTLTILIVTGAGVLLCASHGVEFPSRQGRR